MTVSEDTELFHTFLLVVSETATICNCEVYHCVKPEDIIHFVGGIRFVTPC